MNGWLLFNFVHDKFVVSVYNEWMDASVRLQEIDEDDEIEEHSVGYINSFR